MNAAPPGLSRVLSRISEIRSTPPATGFDRTLQSAMAVPTVAVTDERLTRTVTDRAPESLPPDAARWTASITRAADRAGIDPALLTAVVWTESGFRPDAVSPAGAIGLAQLMPGTADALGVDAFDPDQNLAGGARYLAEMLDRFGSPDLALAAYNAGPGTVARHLADPATDAIPDSTRTYAQTVLDRHARLAGGTP